MSATDLKRKITHAASLVPKGFEGNELANVEYHADLLIKALTQANERYDYREARNAMREAERLKDKRTAKATADKKKKAAKERELQKEIDRTAAPAADVKIEE